MNNPIRFTPGQTTVVDGTIDARNIIRGMSRTAVTKWRIERVKQIVRSKPNGFLFTNFYFRERLGFQDDNGFWSLKNTAEFKRNFHLTQQPGTHKYELSVIGDAKTVRLIEPSFGTPTVQPDSEVTPRPVAQDNTTPATTPATTPDSFLELAKQVAIEKLAREMTVGEVLDGAKQFNLL